MPDAEPLSEEEWRFWDSWMRAQRRLELEVDRTLQREFDLSKSEFAILITLQPAPSNSMRVTDIAEALDWEKGRVAHLLTRMETRGLLDRTEAGAPGRRTGVALTAAGTDLVDRATVGHGRSIRRLVLDRLAPDQRRSIADWSRSLLDAPPND